MGFTGLAVPGATVTATQGDKQIVTTTDQRACTGSPISRKARGRSRSRCGASRRSRARSQVVAGAQAAVWELALLPFEEIARGLPPPVSQAATAASGGASQRTERFAHRAAVARSRRRPPAGISARRRDGADTAARCGRRAAGGGRRRGSRPQHPPADANAANDGFLVNGSVNNGAASPFAQSPRSATTGAGQARSTTAVRRARRATRRGTRRPYSMTGQQTNVPSYYNLHLIGTFQGPLRIPRVLRNGPNLFVGYQRTPTTTRSRSRSACRRRLERNGDFSQTVDGLGRPVQIDRSDDRPAVSRQHDSARAHQPAGGGAARLLPAADTWIAGGRYNYQAPILSAIGQDSVQSRVTQSRQSAQSDLRHRRLSAEHDRRDDALRLRRSRPRRRPSTSR